jgi:hypothetical protein
VCIIIKKFCIEQFGDWVKRSIPEKLNTAKKRTTLFYYRQLAEFGKWCGTLFENARHKLGKDSVFRYRQLAGYGLQLLKNCRP